jgi:dTDP-4-dehydrorhamnose 3,5-epimerase
MGKLDFQELVLKGAFLVTPNITQDERGSFSRVFCQKEFSHITKNNFVQVNHSKTSKKGTLRGMHFQYPPSAEEKIVKCIRGSILDVIVDIRKDSATFLHSYSELLTAQNMKMLFIPKGFAHGFQTLEDDTEILYFHSEFYTQKNEDGLNPKDPRLNISWPLETTTISQKDTNQAFIESSFEGVNFAV